MDEQQVGASGGETPATGTTVGEMVSKLTEAGLNGANWYFWIAGLSLVNTAIAHSGGDRHFIVGLSVTAIADAIAIEVGKETPEAAQAAVVMAVGFSLFIAAVVALFGWLSRKRFNVFFALGMFLYAIDGVIYVLLQDFMSAGFHAFALFSMFQGFKAFRLLNKLEAEIKKQAASVFEPDSED